MVKQAPKEAYELQNSNDQRETGKQRRWLWSQLPCEYPFEGASFSCSLLQAKLIEVELHVRCAGPWKAYILAQTKPLSLLILVFKYIMFYLMSC